MPSVNLPLNKSQGAINGISLNRPATNNQNLKSEQLIAGNKNSKSGMLIKDQQSDLNPQGETDTKESTTHELTNVRFKTSRLGTAGNERGELGSS